MLYAHFLPKALHIFIFPPLLATCPHHVSVTVIVVSLQVFNSHLLHVFAAAREFDYFTFIVRCAVRISTVLLFGYSLFQQMTICLLLE
jgi:hypothetical protein